MRGWLAAGMVGLLLCWIKALVKVLHYGWAVGTLNDRWIVDAHELFTIALKLSLCWCPCSTATEGCYGLCWTSDERLRDLGFLLTNSGFPQERQGVIYGSLQNKFGKLQHLLSCSVGFELQFGMLLTITSNCSQLLSNRSKLLHFLLLFSRL